MGETMDDLVKRNGLYYKKFSDTPFTGKVTGEIQGSIENGKKVGAWVYYWGNGQLKSKGNYKNGKEEGAWVGYDRDGTLSKSWTGTFKNGIKISD